MVRTPDPEEALDGSLAGLLVPGRIISVNISSTPKKVIDLQPQAMRLTASVAVSSAEDREGTAQPVILRPTTILTSDVAQTVKFPCAFCSLRAVLHNLRAEDFL